MVIIACLMFACHIDLIKMEESNKMTDDGYLFAACCEIIQPICEEREREKNACKRQKLESKRHEINIIDILASIHFIGVAVH